MILFGIAAGALVALGLVMFVAWFRPAPPKPVTSRNKTKPRLSQRWAALPAKTKNTVIIGVVVGVAAALITSIPLLIVAVPLAMVGLPALLGKPSNRDTDMVLALEAWARSLASTAETGQFTLREVIGVSRAAAPEILRDPIERLYARMSTTWSSKEALRAFADELDSADADEVVIYLIQAAQFSSGGLSRALSTNADALAQSAKLRIDTLAERDRPRQVLQQMTIIATVISAAVLAMGGQMMSFYRTPVGGVVLTVLLGLFVLCLIWGKQTAKSRPDPRIVLSKTIEEQLA